MNTPELLEIGREELNEHLRGFISSFIQKDYQQRWINILLETPNKAIHELGKFPVRLDARYCTEVTSIDAIGKLWGNHTGVYFDGISPVSRITLADAELKTWNRSADSIFSLESGKKAVFFFHENLIWVCEK